MTTQLATLLAPLTRQAADSLRLTRDMRDARVLLDVAQAEMPGWLMPMADVSGFASWLAGESNV